MRSKLILVLLILAIGASSPALAQERKPIGEFNASYNLITDFDVTGHGFNVGIIGNPLRWLGIEAQFDAWYDIAGGGVDLYTTVGGPRVAFRTRNVTPFVHFLAGGAYSRFAKTTDSQFVMKFGAGVDVNFGPRGKYAWRVEVNDLMFVDPVDHNFTASSGFVLRWQ